MTDLVIHIGMPKCGSTTLQREVFAHESGYLGTHPDIPRDENLAKQLQHCGPFGGRQTFSRRALHRWADRVRALQQDRWPDIDRIIASDEVLSAKSRFEERPILRLLSHLNESVWREGAVKAIIVLRNQPERLASGYAQGSSDRINAGQADFEDWVAKRLGNLPNYDYAKWVAGLQDVLGAQNVFTLLLEESMSEAHWRSLKDFAALQELDPQSMVMNATIRNQRREAPDRWRVSSFDAQTKAKIAVDKSLNLVWPRHLWSDSRVRVRDASIARLARHYDLLHAKRAHLPRETTITLTPKIRSQIKAHFGDSNRKLRDYLERDIAKLGYE